MKNYKNGYDFIDGYSGVWRTVGGRRIFIRDGEPLDVAMQRSGKFNMHPERKYDSDVNFIGKMPNADRIEKEVGLKFKNKDIIITNERKEHIFERRNEKDYKLLMKSLSENIYHYDEILLQKKENKISLVFTKNHDEKIYVVIISPSFIDESKANSIITCVIMNNRTFKRFKRDKIEIK